MKKNLLLAFAFIFLLTNCKSVLDKPINKDDFTHVKNIISKSDTLNQLKKNYIIDKLAITVGGAEISKLILSNNKNIPSFRETINNLSTDYDNQRKIMNFITLLEAKAFPIDDYTGYLLMKVKFNNTFKNDILYIDLNYKYIDKYDSQSFDNTCKVTDNVANNFKGIVQLTTNESFNDVAEFMHKNLPFDTIANSVYLMKNLKIFPVLIVFKDKSQIEFDFDDLKYFKK